VTDADPRWLPPALRGRIGHLDPISVVGVAEHLRDQGGEALEALQDTRLERAFLTAVDAFRDPRSEERRRLDPALRETAALSQGCLDASLAALLDGFTPGEVRAVLTRARQTLARRGARRRSAESEPGPAPREPRPRPHLVVLAGSLPGLVFQPLLASLSLRRPALLKSSSREPLFAPALARALAAREPALRDAVAAVDWRGGETAIEEPLFAAVDRVVAYGGGAALADLRRRAGSKLIAFGPKASVGLVGGGLDRVELRRAATGLARDVALFEQRGCLSLQAVFTDGDADGLALLLAGALEEAARAWPPPSLSAAAAASVRLAREEAAFLGGSVAATPLEHATVIIDRRALFLPPVGHRTVRIHPVKDLGAALDILRPHAPRLQGAALAGAAAGDDELRRELHRLGVSYLCEPGRLQSPGAGWANGGIDLVARLLAGR
jgi:hypothetical protein